MIKWLSDLMIKWFNDYMKIIKIDPSNPEPKIIDETIEVLKNGGVVVYPSDTCYGLGADITNPFALDKLYKNQKKRVQ